MASAGGVDRESQDYFAHCLRATCRSSRLMCVCSHKAPNGTTQAACLGCMQSSAHKSSAPRTDLHLLTLAGCSLITASMARSLAAAWRACRSTAGMLSLGPQLRGSPCSSLVKTSLNLQLMDGMRYTACRMIDAVIYVLKIACFAAYAAACCKVHAVMS